MRQQRQLPLALVLLWAIGTVVYAQALAVGYLTDDYALVGAAASPSYRLWDAFPAGRGTYFRPLVMLTLRLEWLVARGQSPLVHHVTNALRSPDDARPALFITSPDQLHDVPLFSNDLSAALHHCMMHTFGQLDLDVVAPVALARPSDVPQVEVERLTRERFRAAVKSDATFWFDGLPSSVLTPTEVEPSGEIRTFEVVLSNTDSADLLFFDGQHLARVQGAGR